MDLIKICTQTFHMYSLKRQLGRGEKIALQELSWFLPLAICDSGNQIIENEMGETNGM